jgi:hypothetical protein
MTRVAEAMDEYDRCRVPGDSREEQRGTSGGRHLGQKEGRSTKEPPETKN